MARHSIVIAVAYYLAELRRAHRVYDAIPIDDPNVRRWTAAGLELSTAVARYLHAHDNLEQRRDILRESRKTQQGDLSL